MNLARWLRFNQPRLRVVWMQDIPGVQHGYYVEWRWYSGFDLTPWGAAGNLIGYLWRHRDKRGLLG